METLEAILLIVMMVGVTRKIYAEEKMLGPADVILRRVEACPNAASYDYSDWTVERKKISRTLEAFSAKVKLEKTMDSSLGAYVNVAKNGDGGWKENFYVMEENDACNYLMKYGDDNFRALLVALGAEPECPVPAGSYTLDEFMVDHDKLPENLTYGEFRIDAFLTDAARAKKRVMCVRIYADCIPKKE